MTEDELARLLFGKGGLAPMLGWDYMHIRPGMFAGGKWRTSTSGTLAAWPDHVLVRVRDRRLIFAELKRELGKVTPEQEHVLGILRSLEVAPADRDTVAFAFGPFTAVEIYVWRPSDLRDPIGDSVIGRTLR
ncbi:MAG: hypothetical protein L0227_11025 [Chloroflexi bacterium]|nr:hypothetical protein [Chloroflexota bacterium]